MTYSSNTYLRDVEKHTYKEIINDNWDYSITIKKIVKMKEPFQLIEFNEPVTILDNNYYILEMIPKNDSYIIRLFINDKKEVVEQIILLTNNNSFVDGIPVYEDLKVCIVKRKENSKIYHEELITEENKKKVEELKSKELPFDYKLYL